MKNIRSSPNAAARAFTIVELMVVIAVIGLLAALAIPRYRLFTCKAQQSEAKSILTTSFKTLEAYYHENDPELATPFSLTFDGCHRTSVGSSPVAFSPKGTSRYFYSIWNVPGKYYEVSATGCTTDNAGEQWESWHCFGVDQASGCVAGRLDGDLDVFASLDSCTGVQH